MKFAILGVIIGAGLVFAQPQVNPFPPSSKLVPGALTSGTVTSVATSCGLIGGTITATGTISQAVATAAHNGTYAILTADCGKSLTTNTGAAWTISQAGTAGFEAGKYWIANNIGSGSLTITATTSTFYGGPSANISGSVLTVAASTSAEIISDGVNYQVISGGSATNGSSTDILTSNGSGGFGTSLPVPLVTGKGGTGSTGLNGVRVGNGSSADTAVSGSATNCVLVNGTSGPCDAPGQQAVSNTTPVTASNPSTTTALQQLTLTSGMFNVSTASGGVFTYNASGYYTVAALQTPTLTWVLNACTVSGCGSGTVRALATIVSQAVVTAANNTWNTRITISNTAIGASGTLLGQGCASIELTSSSDLGTISCDSTTASSSAIDLTGVIYLQLTVLASSSNAGNSVVALKSSLEPAGAIGPTGLTGANCNTYTVNNNGTNWTVAINGGGAVAGAAIAAATTQSITLFALPTNGIVMGVDVHGTTGWSGTGFTALSATVGDSVGGATFYESTSFDLTTSGNTAFVDSVLFKHATFAGSNVQLAVTANQNLNANTITGATDVRACYVTP